MPKKRPKSVFRRRNVQTPYTRISVRLVENILPLVTGESVSFFETDNSILFVVRFKRN